MKQPAFRGLAKRLIAQGGFEPDDRFTDHEEAWIKMVLHEERVRKAVDEWVPNMRDTASTRIRDFLWAHHDMFTTGQIKRACRITKFSTYRGAVERLIAWRQAHKPKWGMLQYHLGVVPRKLPNLKKNSDVNRKYDLCKEAA